jgi:hypothetical protein
MDSELPPQIKGPLEEFDCSDAELVIAVVCAVGTDYGPIGACVADILEKFGYKTRTIRISNLIPTLTDRRLEESPEIARITFAVSWQVNISEQTVRSLPRTRQPSHAKQAVVFTLEDQAMSQLYEAGKA